MISMTQIISNNDLTKSVFYACIHTYTVQVHSYHIDNIAVHSYLQLLQEVKPNLLQASSIRRKKRRKDDDERRKNLFFSLLLFVVVIVSKFCLGDVLFTFTQQRRQTRVFLYIIILSLDIVCSRYWYYTCAVEYYSTAGTMKHNQPRSEYKTVIPVAMLETKIDIDFLDVIT